MGIFIGLVLGVAGYLIGSINFSILMVKWLKGTDIRKVGSGNAGATNTLRYLGKGPAILVLLLDLTKGIVSVGMAYWIAPTMDWLPVITGLAAVVGHNWPIYFGFRGGKGVATTIGVNATLAFLPAVFAAVFALSAIAITRYVSLGSLIFITLVPVFMILFNGFTPELVAAGIILILGYIRHAQNISNLINGSERKLGEKVE